MIISANYQQENFQILMMRRVTLATNRVEKNDNSNIYNKEDIGLFKDLLRTFQLSFKDFPIIF